MGWLRTIFLGDIGNRLDIADTERAIDALRRDLKESKRTDRSQDEQLEFLDRENYELKLAFGALTQLLVRQKILSREDVETTFSFVEED